MLEEINNLKEQLIIFELDLSSNDKITFEKIKSLQLKLDDSIATYQKEIQYLNDINKEYFEQLEFLSSNINFLEKKVDDLNDKEGINANEIETLKYELANYYEQYNNAINNIELFNVNYMNSLKEMDIKIKEIFSKLETLEIINQEESKELNSKINQNSIFLNNLEDNNKILLEEVKKLTSKLGQLEDKVSDTEIRSNEQYENILTNQNDINEKITSYESIISILNEQSNLEIEFLKAEFLRLTNDIEKINNKKEYESILNYQKLIYEKLTDNDEEILNIKENQNVYNQDIEKLKEDILYVSNKIEQTDKSNNLNTKLNDYILKINGEEVVNLLWIYIVLTLIFCIYLIYLFKKKSNKKIF